MVHRWIWATVVMLSLLGPSATRAGDVIDPNAQARQAARTLANKGYKHFKAGEYKKAIEAFGEAEKHFHAPTILVVSAQAHIKLGHWVEALSIYKQVIDEKLENYAPLEFFEAQKQAVREHAALHARVPKLLVTVKGPPAHDIRIQIDGTAVKFSESEPILQNPGKHTLLASAKGYATVTREVSLSEGAIEPLAIELQPTTKAPPVESSEPVPPKEVQKPDTSVGDSQKDPLWPAFVALGVGGLGLGMGAATGLVAMNKANGLDERCPNRLCEYSDMADHSTATTMATLSTIGFAVGGVGVVAGVTLLIVRPFGKPTEPTRLTFRPGWIGFVGDF